MEVNASQEWRSLQQWEKNQYSSCTRCNTHFQSRDRILEDPLKSKKTFIHLSCLSGKGSPEKWNFFCHAGAVVLAVLIRYAMKKG